MQAIREITVVGMGGVGGYVGNKLALLSAPDKPIVTFFARGQTFERIRQEGLSLISQDRSVSAVRPDRLLDNPALINPNSVILLCVKAYDLPDVCRQLALVVQQNTVILPLMNGIDIPELIRSILPDGIVLPTCIYVFAHSIAPGLVEQKGNPARIFVGLDPARPDYSPEGLVGLLSRAGMLAEYQADVQRAIWTKFLFIASFGLVTARYNKSIGQVLDSSEPRQRVQQIMHEIMAIARQKRIDLPPDAVEQTLQRAAAMPYEGTTSLQLDVNAGKIRNELDLFAGTVERYGESLGIDVDATRDLRRQIESIVVESQEARS